MKWHLLAATFFYGISSYAQSSSGFKNELYQHLSVLAHDSMEGRETGTPGIEKAANYIELCFRNMELNPVKGLKTYRQVYKTPYLNAWAFNVMAQLDMEYLEQLFPRKKKLLKKLTPLRRHPDFGLNSRLTSLFNIP